ncbi:hypothetical protein BGZ61DRAFT_590999 [Ilyonectria robusta]|uniref:uncharacterized protein n=1 Tax=Ilyonectria robusta TaxID=1079257 RepID=UPI001E8EC348|nr:uncharacterized protein BGZ61DRAFT_590999 [Ilyonectria robusta]KAH8676953.1 hypothetical protein BGZ61DRAFT_590999 [Ilyonectria robusta]
MTETKPTGKKPVFDSTKHATLPPFADARVLVRRLSAEDANLIIHMKIMGIADFCCFQREWKSRLFTITSGLRRIGSTGNKRKTGWPFSRLFQVGLTLMPHADLFIELKQGLREVALSDITIIKVILPEKGLEQDDTTRTASARTCSRKCQKVLDGWSIYRDGLQHIAHFFCARSHTDLNDVFKPLEVEAKELTKIIKAPKARNSADGLDMGHDLGSFDGR